MPTTRRQAKAALETKASKEQEKEEELDVGEKRPAEETEAPEEEEPPAKKTKKEEEDDEQENGAGDMEVDDNDETAKQHPQTGVIERGHIYFFYRPKVDVEEAGSIDDVQRFQFILVPRPPESNANAAVPQAETKDRTRKRFRIVTVGKKQLPHPEEGGSGKGKKRVLWATIGTVGEDLQKLEDGLDERTYETKTKGARHLEPARPAGRGAYVIVNNDPEVPSKRETHLGYYLSHPAEPGDIQKELGIYQASSFVLQVRNPEANVSGPPGTGLPKNKRAKYPEEIMLSVFGKGGSKGREPSGLRFTPIERVDLLDYEGAELLLIAARGGEEGLEASVGEENAKALEKTEKKDRKESIDDVFRELTLDIERFPVDALKGHWI
ncbi:hypothetical protein PUNSTDRAFT_129672 [Punctularia strigosozonata HHB-11173 SS5]|uniref:uncharacterized protein n=1 Tax=Punctularia strigosozonata (strain HHB-11173) TaxID=741275 RepID=UPI00044178BB|nr:uncharacterized protein PUNSTDRAFT_129672 [Punctularia strigosozonata HHB-11173 SS5]EIN14025.1 hypothetical protein PUNSTDRAFT_129672 [Punctularia strigosozonata HHB-11173 SS5]